MTALVSPLNGNDCLLDIHRQTQIAEIQLTEL